VPSASGFAIRKEPQLGLGLHVHEAHAGFHTLAELARAFPDASEHDVLGREAGLQCAIQLATGHDLGPAA